MPIKQRLAKSSGPDYHTYRATRWESIDRTGFSFGNSCFIDENGNRRKMRPGEVIFQPKRNVLLKDIWHCGTPADAKTLIHTIIMFPDIIALELKGSWVWVTHNHHGKDHLLPGQITDDREKTFG